MLKTSARPTVRTLLAAAAFTILFSLGALADSVYVTTYNSSGTQNCPPEFSPNALGLSGVTISGGCGSGNNGTTAIAKPPGLPITRPKATFGSAGTCNWSIQTQTPLQHNNVGDVYTIEVAHTATSASTDVRVTAYSSDGVVSASCTNSAVFDKNHGGDAWQLMGYITNTSGAMTQPTITFIMTGGAALTTSSRLYIDCFKMTLLDPCMNVGAVTVNGPAVAGQTTVYVSGVVGGATEVDVYADGSLIGSTNSTGMPAGIIPVATTALVGGQNLTARQYKGSCDGGLSSAIPVGGGPNPTLQVALGLAWTNNLTGPIGAAGNGNCYSYWVHANGRRTFSYGVAPSGGFGITPSTNWVTLTFNSDSDFAAGNTYDWQKNVVPYTNNENWAVLESLALAIDDMNPDIGPYRIYIDSIYNGTNLIQGFEASSYGTSYTNGTYGVMFLRPSASGTTSAWLSSPPDTNYVYNAHGVNSDTGTNSLAVEWVFKDKNVNNWVRLYTGGSGTQYPQVDLHQPITVRMLVLPVGEAVGRRFNGNVSWLNASLPAFWATGSNTFSVSVTGTGSYTYQWSHNNTDVPGATDAAYTVGLASGLATNDAGLYTVTVTDEGGGTIARSINLRTSQIVDPLPTITNQPATAIVPPGAPASFTVGADGHTAAGYPLVYQWYHNGAAVGTDSSAYTIASAQTADVGNYQVVVTNNFGAVTSQVAVLGVVSDPLGTGTGLHGDYYTKCTNGVNNFVGAPTLSRTDATVNFNWGTTGSPAPSISSDYFMARWSGQVQAVNTDTYTFLTTSDDGIRLWVNGQPIINHWNPHSPATDLGTVALVGGQKYDLMLEYFEQGGGAVAQLMWSNATATLPQMAIPQSQLYPASGPVIPSLTTSVSNGTNLTLNWAAGSYTVLGAGNVNGPYTNVAVGAISPYLIPIGAQPQMYYRLKVQ